MPTEQIEQLEKILIGCRNNDIRSQKDLYKNYYSLALKICLRYANNKMDAVSIVNEGFYKIFINVNQYDLTRPFTTWLSRIMTNAAIDFYRASLRFSSSMISIEDGFTEETMNEPIHAKLNYEDLLSMVQSLSPAYRTVFNLYAIEGYSHEEIATMLGISVGASKLNLFKARAKLSYLIKMSEEPVSIQKG